MGAGLALLSPRPLSRSGRWSLSRWYAEGRNPSRRDPSGPERNGSGRGAPAPGRSSSSRSEEHTSELQSRLHLVCRLLLEKKKTHYINRVLAEVLLILEV